MVTRTKKIFVGGLSAPSTLEDVKNYFEQFGKVGSRKYFDFFAKIFLALLLSPHIFLSLSLDSAATLLGNMMVLVDSGKGAGPDFQMSYHA